MSTAQNKIIYTLPPYAVEQANHIAPFYFLLKNTKKVTQLNHNQLLFYVNDFYNKNNDLISVMPFLDELKQLKNGLHNKHNLKSINNYKSDLQLLMKRDLDAMARILRNTQTYAPSLFAEFIDACFKYCKNRID